jgi:hypothetical protein
MTRSRLLTRALPAVVALGLSACTTSSPAPATPPTPSMSTAGTSTAGQRFPDVVVLDPTTLSTTTTSVAVTLSSPYDTPARYADAIRVRSTDATTTYGTVKLGHDHATEQPFTRTLTGLHIPAGVSTVIVEGHDQVNGWGGGTLTVQVTS